MFGPPPVSRATSARLRGRRALTLALGLALALATPAHAEEWGGGGAKTPQEIARGAFPSVVMVVMNEEGSGRVSQGSGFFVGDGLVATNFHVISGAGAGWVRVIGEEKRYAVEGVVAADREHDLAVLKLRSGGPSALPLGKAEDLQIADKVYAIGNPRGLEGTFSEGLVSSIRRLERGAMLQITAPISEGSSGGPVFDDRGRVVGVAVGMLKDGQNLNFAIPVTYLQKLLGAMTNPVPLADATLPDAGTGPLPRHRTAPTPPDLEEPGPMMPEPEGPRLSPAEPLPTIPPMAGMAPPPMQAPPPVPAGPRPAPAMPDAAIDCGTFTCELPPGWSLERNDSASAAFSASRRAGGFALLTVFFRDKAGPEIDDVAGSAIATLGEKYVKHRVIELAGERAYLIMYKAAVDAGPVFASDVRVIHADVEYTISLWSDANASDIRAIGADFESLAHSWRWK